MARGCSARGHCRYGVKLVVVDHLRMPPRAHCRPPPGLIQSRRRPDGARVLEWPPLKRCDCCVLRSSCYSRRCCWSRPGGLWRRVGRIRVGRLARTIRSARYRNRWCRWRSGSSGSGWKTSRCDAALYSDAPTDTFSFATMGRTCLAVRRMPITAFHRRRLGAASTPTPTLFRDTCSQSATSIIGAVPPARRRSSHKSRPSTRAASSPDIGSRQISRVAQGDP